MNERRYTRRDFINFSLDLVKATGLSLALGNFLSGCEIGETKYDKRFVEGPEAAKLELNIENKFNIRLMTQGQWDEEIWDGRLSEGHPDLEAKWNMENLSLISGYLETLPAHFTKEKYKGKKLRIIITHLPFTDCDCFPDPKGNDPDEMFISLYLITNSSKEQGFATLAHEFSHRMTPFSLPTPVNKSESLLEQLQSPWFERINAILGEDFKTARLKINEKILALDPDIAKKWKLELRERKELTQEEQKSQFLYRLAYGLGTRQELIDSEKFNLPTEFIGVLGENYVYGKDYFMSMYKFVLPEEIVGKLYEFTKTEIFKGREYL